MTDNDNTQSESDETSGSDETTPEEDNSVTLDIQDGVLGQVTEFVNDDTADTDDTDKED